MHHPIPNNNNNRNKITTLIPTPLPKKPLFLNGWAGLALPSLPLIGLAVCVAVSENNGAECLMGSVGSKPLFSNTLYNS